MDNAHVPALSAADQRWLAGWHEGPQRTRWAELPLQAGDHAADLVLEHCNGKAVRLSSIWSESPVILVFLRHFGCSCATSRLERLAEELPKLTAAGAQVLCIGQAEPERSIAFKTARNLQVPLLCDPLRRAYVAYGLLEGTPPQIVYGAPDEFLLRDAAAGAALQRSRLGTPRAPVDSPWQLPGDFVVDQGGRLRLAHRPCYCDGAIDTEVLLSAIRAGQLEGSLQPS